MLGAGTAFTALRIRTSDACFSAFFGFIQIEYDSRDDGEKYADRDNVYDDLISHNGLPK